MSIDFGAFVGALGGVGWALMAFIVALSVIVAIHEYGHYIVGRWCGIDAEVFSIGFGPVITSGMDSRGTRWQIAALPFGGYVKFLGDENAASVGADPDVAPSRNTMHGAPLWARTATVAAGPIFNFILAAIVFAGVALYRGEAVEPLTVATIAPQPMQTNFTLAPGDVILSVEGGEITDLSSFRAMSLSVPEVTTLSYTVRRGDDTLIARGPHPLPPLVGSVNPGSAADAAGIKSGDVVTEAAGILLTTFGQLQTIVADAGDQPVDLVIWRNGETLSLNLAAERVDLPTADGGFETRYLIGIVSGNVIEPETRFPNVLDAALAGMQQTAYIVETSISGLWHVIKGSISSCNISGPVGIAETSGAMASQGLLSFISFIAVLSAAIGLFNLFPIPMLDGGHLVFFAYEAISGQTPSPGVLQVFVAVGIAMVASLMVFALGNDLFFC